MTFNYRKLFIALFGLFLVCEPFSSYAQLLNFNFALGAGTPTASDDEAKKISVDGNGNIFLLCDFDFFINMDTAYYGATQFSSNGGNDVAFAKYNAQGQLQWAKQIKSRVLAEGKDIALDSNGNIYVLLSYKDTIDIDPSPTINHKISLGDSDILLAKYDSTGNLIWANSFGTAGAEYGLCLDVTTNGTIYCLGGATSAVDLDPSSAVQNIQCTYLYGAFIAKYNTNGQLLHSKIVAGRPLNFCRNAGNDFFFAGTFLSTVDIDPGSAVLNITSLSVSDMMVVKYDSNFNYVTHINFAGAGGGDYIYSIACDGLGNVILGGQLNSTVDVNPSAAVNTIGTPGGFKGWLGKYSGSLAYQWAYAMQSSSVSLCSTIKCDDLNNIYSAGTFGYTCDFDPSSSVVNYSSIASNSDVYLQKLSPSGVFQWVRLCRGKTLFETAVDLEVDPFNNIVMAGSFKDTVNVDYPIGNTIRWSLWEESFYVSKFNTNGDFLGCFTSNDCFGGDTRGRKVAITHTNDVIVAGISSGKVDFDYSADTAYSISANVYSKNIFLVKYNASGNLIWLKSAVTGWHLPNVEGLKTDTLGNIYVYGKIHSWADLDPSSTSTLMVTTTYASYSKTFFLKLDPNGNLLWVNVFENETVIPIDMDVDKNGNIALTGTFSGLMDFDFGAGVQNLIGVSNSSMFIACYNTLGQLYWAKSSQTIAAIQTQEKSVIKFDQNKNVYLGTQLASTYDFDFSTSGTANHTAVPSNGLNLMLVKYDSAGNYVYSKQMTGGNMFLTGLDIKGNNIYLSGYFYGTVDVDFSSTVNNVSTSLYYSNLFIGRYDMNGNLIVAKGFGGNATEQFLSMCVNDNQRIFLYGISYNNNTWDIDPGSPIVNGCIGSNMFAGFLVEYDNMLNYIDSKIYCEPPNLEIDVDCNNSNVCFTNASGNSNKAYSFDLNPGGAGGIVNSINNSMMVLAHYNLGFALPVDFITFDAIKTDNTATLDWMVPSFNDLGNFEIERSEDGLHFYIIGIKPLQNNLEHEFQFIDEHVVAGRNYYRIRFRSLDGSSFYSPIKYIDFDKDFISVSPNPFHDDITIANCPPGLTLSIVSGDGRMIYSKKLTEGSNSINLTALSVGSYILVLKQRNQILSRKTIYKK